jgi:hypothetical protein
VIVPVIPSFSPFQLFDVFIYRRTASSASSTSCSSTGGNDTPPIGIKAGERTHHVTNPRHPQ